MLCAILAEGPPVRPCRWPFLSAQQQIFTASILDITPGVAGTDVTFIAAVLEAASAGTRRHRRALAQATPADNVQSVNVTFHIQTPSAVVAKAVASKLYNSTLQGTFAVGMLSPPVTICLAG